MHNRSILGAPGHTTSLFVPIIGRMWCRCLIGGMCTSPTPCSGQVGIGEMAIAMVPGCSASRNLFGCGSAPTLTTIGCLPLPHSSRQSPHPPHPTIHILTKRLSCSQTVPSPPPPVTFGGFQWGQYSYGISGHCEGECVGTCVWPHAGQRALHTCTSWYASAATWRHFSRLYPSHSSPM